MQTRVARLASLPLVLTLYLGLALSACRSEPSRTVASADAGARWLGGFAPYAGARTLCGQHLSGAAAEVAWTVYATGDEPERVVGFYRQRVSGEAPRELASGGWVIAGADGVRLSVLPVGGGHFPHCDNGPAAGERTVLVVSQIARR